MTCRMVYFTDEIINYMYSVCVHVMNVCIRYNVNGILPEYFLDACTCYSHWKMFVHSLSVSLCLSLSLSVSLSLSLSLSLLILDHLGMLIKETKDRGIEFVYAIAPGLDITFSDDKEILSLKRKLEQVPSTFRGREGRE